MKQDIFDAQMGDGKAVQDSVSQWNLHAVACRREVRGAGVYSTNDGWDIREKNGSSPGILVFNPTDAAIKPGDIVAFDSPLYDPAPDAYNNASGDFFWETALRLKAPDENTGERFGVALDLIPIGAYGKVIVIGDARCKIHLEDAADRGILRAAVDPNDSTHLGMNPGGRALVLWVAELENYPGDAWAIVNLDSGISGGAYRGLVVTEFGKDSPTFQVDNTVPLSKNKDLSDDEPITVSNWAMWEASAATPVMFTWNESGDGGNGEWMFVQGPCKADFDS